MSKTPFANYVEPVIGFSLRETVFDTIDQRVAVILEITVAGEIDSYEVIFGTDSPSLNGLRKPSDLKKFGELN